MYIACSKKKFLWCHVTLHIFQFRRLVTHRQGVVDSSSSPSHNSSIQNHVEPQRHHTISGPTSGRSSNGNGWSNGSTNLVAQTSSPTKSSSSANSSPKMGKRTLSTSASNSRPRRHAPPPPAGGAVGDGAVGGAHLSRKNKTKALKDNRYSLQVDPRDFHDASFRSLPRRTSAGPPPPVRVQSMSENPLGSSSGTKPPLHPSVSLGSANSLQDAKLAGYSSFVNPHQTGSSTLQPVSAPVRRYSSDATPSSGTLQITPTSPEVRRSSMGEVAAAAQQPTSDVRYQHTQSTGSLGSGNVAITNRPQSGSSRNSTSSSPSSPVKNRSRSTSKEGNFDHLGPSPIMKLDLPTSFSNSDGMELVEAVRKKTGVSHRKSMIAINEVLEFLKNRVPMCGEMVDALLAAVQESTEQVHVHVMSITMYKMYVHVTCVVHVA